MHPLMPVDARVLARVRRICLGWPSANFVLTPYSAHQGWVSLYTDRKFDWDEIADYLRVGYRLVAQKRMLAAMDAMEVKPTKWKSKATR